MNKFDEKEWEKAFKADMKVLDDVHHVRIPDEDEWLMMLQQFKAKRQRTFVREFIVFFMTALIIFALYVVIAFKLTVVFIWIQVLVFFVVPLLLFEQKYKNSRDEVFRNGR